MMNRSFQQLNNKLKRALSRLQIQQQQPPAPQLDVPTDPTELERREVATVEQFLSRGCGCLLFNGGPCSSQLSSTAHPADESELS